MISKTNRVLLVEDNPGDARLLHEMLKDAASAQFDLTDAGRLQDALELLGSQSFDIVLLDLRLPDSQGFDTFTRLSSQFPAVPIVVMTGLQDETVALQAVNEGAQDYLVKGQVDGEQLARSLRYAIARHTTQQARQESAPAKRGRVLGCWGAKGGVGATTLVLNIASALQASNRSVIAAELRSAYGTFSAQLPGVPTANISQLAAMEPESITGKDLATCLSASADGVRVLFGPQRVDEFREIAPECARVIVEGLADLADFVIVDMGCYPSPTAEALTRLCDYIVLATVPEPTWFESVRMALVLLKSWGLREERLGLATVNRAGLYTSVNLQEVSNRMQCGIVGSVPSAADDMLAAQQMGQPVVVCAPHSRAAISLSELAQRLAADRVLPLVQPTDEV